MFLHPNEAKQNRDTAHRLEFVVRNKVFEISSASRRVLWVVKIQPIKITLERSVNKFVVFLNDCNACPVAAFYLFIFLALWGHTRPPCYCTTQSVCSLSGCPCSLGAPFAADGIVLTVRQASQTKLNRDNFLWVSGAPTSLEPRCPFPDKERRPRLTLPSTMNPFTLTKCCPVVSSV